MKLHGAFTWDLEKLQIHVQPSSTTSYLSSLEVQNLDYFRNVCAGSFSEFFQDDFWGKSIMRYTASFPSIRYAALAVAAVHRALAFPKLESAAHDIVSSQRDAFTNYTKAIELLAPSLIDDPTSRELACVASLLFITFEVLRGNDSASMVHIDAAFSILQSS
jgi:hypothetical protein